MQQRNYCVSNAVHVLAAMPLCPLNHLFINYHTYSKFRALTDENLYGINLSGTWPAHQHDALQVVEVLDWPLLEFLDLFYKFIVCAGGLR